MNINITILGQTISFIFFVWFCMKYVWSPLILVIEKRQKDIADSLEKIKKSQIDSDRMHFEALSCLKKAQIKAQKIIQEAYHCKIQILSEAKDVANKERERILLQSRDQMNRERMLVTDELIKKIGQFIILGTEKILEKSIDDSIDRDFVDNIIKKLSYED